MKIKGLYGIVKTRIMVSDGGLRMIDKNEDRWIGIEDAAEYLDVNKDTIRNWIKKWTQTYRHTG